MPLTTYGKLKIAEAMYYRGKHFLAASILLQQRGGYEYVTLHLMCQGLEIMLKSFLLVRDFDKYKPIMRKFGHNLVALSDEALSVYGLNQMRPPVRLELVQLNKLYQEQVLRYADIHDIFVDPKTIEDTLVARRITACLALAERSFARGLQNPGDSGQEGGAA